MRIAAVLLVVPQKGNEDTTAEGFAAKIEDDVEVKEDVGIDAVDVFGTFMHCKAFFICIL